VHVPAGPAEGIRDVVASTIAGDTAYVIAPIPLVLDAIRDGRLVALGTTAARRSPLLPDVPTIAEAGLPGFDYAIWYGVWAPARTPAAVVERLARDVARALAAPDLRDELARHGGEALSLTQPEFARFVAAETEKAARILGAAGVKVR
jgi:tripartite-type tricarboxylate transporter receptor subunit TctC